ncbi:hypothetical protein C8R32_10137 [Nitrosospira sp. Nsp5]|nr:hypothetical protein C8R32_10137 [Nitrosospira sp. Nsp5]
MIEQRDRKVTAKRRRLTRDLPFAPIGCATGATVRAATRYPFHLRDSRIMDTVMVEFFIDKEGWVHLPRMIEAKNEELG